MALPTRKVTCRFYDQNGDPVGGASVEFLLTKPDTIISGGLLNGIISPEVFRGKADANGVLVINVVPNTRGTTGTQYRVTAKNPQNQNKKFVDALCTVPDQDCNLEDILFSAVPIPLDAAQQAVIAAQAAAAASAGSAAQSQASVPSYGPVPPTNPNVNSEWVDSNSGRRFKYIDDGDTAQWIETGSVNSIGYDTVQDAILSGIARDQAAAYSQSAAVSHDSAKASENNAASFAAETARALGLADRMQQALIDTAAVAVAAQQSVVAFVAANGRITSPAAPTSGTWTRNAVVYHSAPVAGGNVGWVCVAAGTPGTWKPFGTISA